MGQRVTLFSAATLAVLGAGMLGPWTQASAKNGSPGKVLLVVLEPPAWPTAFIKARKAVEYALELKRWNVEVALVFDGPAVEWLLFTEEIPDSQLPEKYKSAEWKGMMDEDQRLVLSKFGDNMRAAGLRPLATRAGAEKAQIKDILDARGIKTAGAHGGPKLDIASYVIGGYQVLIF